jgi:hypothetical protein
MGGTGFATLDLKNIRIPGARRGQAAAKARRDHR